MKPLIKRKTTSNRDNGKNIRKQNSQPIKSDEVDNKSSSKQDCRGACELPLIFRLL